ncbi:hypothetical protein CEXT_696591 [Caerostris extrusa]|uniref:Uncharacterized protein n=1 Tax=Caerostris extrusa TaxID=172846 RepID=A0AAV4XHA5_CAEEX|nr:hypothetical protein CEXT_696591 [Caerostris extrusa]
MFRSSDIFGFCLNSRSLCSQAENEEQESVPDEGTYARGVLLQTFGSGRQADPGGIREEAEKYQVAQVIPHPKFRSAPNSWGHKRLGPADVEEESRLQHGISPPPCACTGRTWSPCPGISTWHDGACTIAKEKI